jgi:hypothetical protein
VILRAFGAGRWEHLFIVEAAGDGRSLNISIQVADHGIAILGPAEFSQACIDVVVNRSERAWTETRGRGES